MSIMPPFIWLPKSLSAITILNVYKLINSNLKLYPTVSALQDGQE
jgi:hypothetical protein